MFVYDKENDEYNEVLPESWKDSIDMKESNISLSLSSKCSSRSNITLKRRIINRNGRRNIFLAKVPRKYVIYFRDLGNTLLNTRWRWILIALCFVNFLSFFIFGVLWMWIAYVSGDFGATQTNKCIVNTNSLTGYILLSIETLLTIGYGYRYPTESCKHAWIVILLQALVSVGIQGVLVSAVYVKISKPFTRNSLNMFSKQAVICLRDGLLCFIVRIVDLNGKVSLGTKITIYFVDKENVGNDEDKYLTIRKLKIKPHGFLIFPLEIVHVIDSSSPLWSISPLELLVKSFEIIVVAEGGSIITGQISQNKISYTNSDVLWGHRFAACVEDDSEKKKLAVNRKKFNHVFRLDTPLCSAQDLDMLRSEL